jgi:hypothetical protein
LIDVLRGWLAHSIIVVQVENEAKQSAKNPERKRELFSLQREEDNTMKLKNAYSNACV